MPKFDMLKIQHFNFSYTELILLCFVLLPMEHCVHRETTFRRKIVEGLLASLRETNHKQTSTFFHCETVPLANNLTRS